MKIYRIIFQGILYFQMKLFSTTMLTKLWSNCIRQSNNISLSKSNHIPMNTISMSSLMFWKLTRPTFNRTPMTSHVEVIPKEVFKSHTPPFKEASLDTLTKWLKNIDMKRKSCFVHKKIVFELLKMEANWLFNLNWFDDALPTPERAQMWAQVGKHRKKEESEHAP